MNSMLHAALGYARRGWRVFPVHGIHNGRCTCGRRNCSSPGKHPLVRRGLHEATAEARAIEEWWRRWQRANVAIATGTVSHVVVIDIDVPAGDGSLETLRARGVVLPPTLSARTGSGGRHLYFTAPDHRLGNAVGSLPGTDGELPGIDLRAEGGYVLVPPSLHASGRRYAWGDPDAELAAVPAWLKARQRQPVVDAVAPALFSGDGTAYGRAALDGALAFLRKAPVGQRNHTLNRIAFSMAQLVAGGEILESAARSSLVTVAIGIGLGDPESRQTIDSAFGAGMQSPRVAPHRMKS